GPCPRRAGDRYTASQAMIARSPTTTETMSDKPQTLTHFDAGGRAHMIDVGDKPATRRSAVATGAIRMQAATLARIREGSADKGDVLGIARIAAIQAAKRTAELIPLCHPLPLTRVSADFHVDDKDNLARCTVSPESTG